MKASKHSGLERRAVLIGLAAFASCAGTARNRATPPDEGPYVLVLGTAQDGGLPHIGCAAPHCQAARQDPRRARLVTSILVCDPGTGSRWLIDCSPDLKEQVELARGHPSTRASKALFDGVFLTHAHMGHYAGLLQLGREAYGVRSLEVWSTPRLGQFLSSNDPYRYMLGSGAMQLGTLRTGEALKLTPKLTLESFAVPHRDEFSDTVGFVVHGPRRKLAYLPDIDKWERWDTEFEIASGLAAPRAIESLIERVDVALLDGCFYADGELPGRPMRDIPHPFIEESIQRFEALTDKQRAKVHFTHLNHTNPAAIQGSAAWRAVRAAGLHVLEDGQRFDL